MFDTTLPAARLIRDHFMGTSSKDEMFLYKSTICTRSTYHVWRQISTCNNIIMPYWHSKGSSNQYFKYCQTRSTLVEKTIELSNRFTSASTQILLFFHTDSSMNGFGAHTDNLKVSGLWTPSQAQNHSKPYMLVIHLVLDHWHLEAIVQKQCHSG